METTEFIVFLTYWKEEGEREGEHILGTYVISLNLHGDLFVGIVIFPCEWAW